MDTKYRILKGKPVSDAIQSIVKMRIDKLGFAPKAIAILVGDDAGAAAYARMKQKRADKFGVELELLKLDKDITQAELIEIVRKLGDSKEIHGIMIERPLPKHIDFDIVSANLNPLKDVDCQTAEALGKIILSGADWYPATAEAVIRILQFYEINITGKNIAIIGRSVSVGKPLAMMLLEKKHSATVTVCHSRTENLKEKTRAADIVIAAIGKANFIDEEYISEGAIVIDVGTNYTENGLLGDVAIDKVRELVQAITPVPGGVGPVTVSILMENCVTAAESSIIKS